jgi:hypothetical protein
MPTVIRDGKKVKLWRRCEKCVAMEVDAGLMTEHEQDLYAMALEARHGGG